MTHVGPEEAIAWCRDHQTWQVGYCQQYVRTSFGVGSLYGSAAEAWEHVNHKHRTENGNNCPRGVPVFWTGGSHGYGHVAVSTGNGYCWSTDAGGPGQVAKVSINGLTSRWGLNFQGWAEDINEHQVYVIPEPKKPAEGWDRVRASQVGPGKDNLDVARVKFALRKMVGNEFGMDLEGKGTNIWGDKTTEAYKAWQKRLGFSGRDANGKPGDTSMRRLARSAGFELV